MAPPEPELEELVKSTRDIVLSTDSQQRFGTTHMRKAREALRKFVANVLSHLRRIGSGCGARAALTWLLGRVRRVAAASGLLVVLAGMTITTGPEFDAVVSLSKDELVQVEITVPVQWAVGSADGAMPLDAADLAQSALGLMVNVAVVNLGEAID